MATTTIRTIGKRAARILLGCFLVAYAIAIKELLILKFCHGLRVFCDTTWASE